jgi:hypothetical protein
MNAKKIGENIEKNITRVCCNYLPKPIRKSALSMLSSFFWLYLKITSIIYESKLHMYLLHGKEKHSGENLTILLISNDAIPGKPIPRLSVNYLSGLLFLDNPRRENIGKIKIKKLSEIYNEYSKKVDAVFLHTDSFYANFLEKKGFIVIPKMISMNLDVSMSLGSIFSNFNKSIKERIRKVEEYNYSYEIATDFDSLNFFYYKMYVPYAQARFGKQAIVWKYHSLRASFENGRLVFITHNNKKILGLLIYDTNKNTSELNYVGMLDGKDDFLKKNINIACNLFSILWAKQYDIKHLDFGVCWSFLNDGILQHNRQWGITIDKYKSHCLKGKYREVLGIKLCNYNKGVQSFLVNNPFICLDKGLLKSMVFVDNNRKVTPQEIKRFKKIYLIPKIAKLIIISPKDLIHKNWKDYCIENVNESLSEN